MANPNIKPLPSKLHEFEGEMLTVAQIALRVPRLNIRTIRTYLKAGRKTRVEMLIDPAAARRKTRLRNQRLWAQGAVV